MRTRLSVCSRKASYRTTEAAIESAQGIPGALRHYLCDRCRQFHLTSRTKGKRIPRPGRAGG